MLLGSSECKWVGEDARCHERGAGGHVRRPRYDIIGTTPETRNPGRPAPHKAAAHIAAAVPAAGSVGGRDRFEHVLFHEPFVQLGLLEPDDQQETRFFVLCAGRKELFAQPAVNVVAADGHGLAR